ncbi:MAG: hypothetical protein RR454_00295 [Clostridia bacterium]
MKLIKNKNKIAYVFALFVMIFSTLFFSFTGFTFAESGNKFDDTNVLDDLKSSTVNGVPFDLNKYPANPLGNISLISFNEYAFSKDVKKQNNFGLYLYVYNPKKLNIDVSSKLNKIQLATNYNKENLPTNYDKLDLEFCNKSNADYNDLFYKFKVKDTIGADGKNILSRLNPEARRYDVSGIEIAVVGARNAVDYGVGGTFIFSGFAKGYGSKDCTLKCEVTELETLKLDVHNTNFRTDTSSKGKGYQNELNSVYFSVPNELFVKYGNLSAVKAEWYEYKTQPILVTSDKTFFDSLRADVGKTTISTKYGFGSNPNFLSTTGGDGVCDTLFDFGYNFVSLLIRENFPAGRETKPKIINNINHLNFLFYNNSIADDNLVISTKTLTDYIYNFRSYSNNFLDIKNGKISKDLFLPTVDTGRKIGKNCVEINSDNKYNLFSYNSSTLKWWQKFDDYGLFQPKENSILDVAPIYELKSNDFTGDISKTLLINKEDVSEFTNFYNTENANNKRTILFRYALTDYYSAKNMVTFNNDGKVNREDDKIQSFTAQETIFLDFDIIQLTFSRNGSLTVIPTVSNPIDVINGITSPFDNLKDWKSIVKLILIILAIIILIIIFAPILIPLIGYIFKGLIWLIKLPYIIIKKIVETCKSNKKNRRKK